MPGTRSVSAQRGSTSSPWTIEKLRDKVAALTVERDEARAVAAVLAHAYETDNRPPSQVVDKARGYQHRRRS